MGDPTAAIGADERDATRLGSARALRDERLLRVSVAAVWLCTGASVVHPYYREVGARYLAALGLPEGVMLATCAAEVLLAVVLLVRRTDRAQAMAQTLPVLAFTAVLAAEEPRLLAHPFGVLTKNVPLLGAVWAAWLLRTEGTGPRVQRLLRASLGAVWIAEGLFPKLVLQSPIELEVVGALGVEAAAASDLVRLAGAAEVAAGVAMLVVPAHRLVPLLVAQVVALVALPILVVVALPEMLVHPFGPLIKNLPILAGTIVLARSCSTSS